MRNEEKLEIQKTMILIFEVSFTLSYLMVAFNENAFGHLAIHLAQTFMM